MKRRSPLHALFIVLVAATSAVAEFPPSTASADVRAALDREPVDGPTLEIDGPPFMPRDSDRENNTAAAGELTLGPRRALTDGVYQRVRKNWLTGQHRKATADELAQRVKERYSELIAAHVEALQLTRIEIEPGMLLYPANYAGNPNPVAVYYKRLKLHANDAGGSPRFLVAYYVNYDRVDPEHPTVIFQINGHFGRNPSRLGLGIEQRGGYSGAALGILALQGRPLITFDDHDVGESSPDAGGKNGLFRTLENLVLLDRALLVHFQAVDGVGLSGGCERLFHFHALHQCRLRSAYHAGYFNSPWTRLDTKARTGGPFGSDPDTDNEVFNSNFQWADFALLGISQGTRIAFANATYEGGNGKNAFVKELRPTLSRFTEDFQVRGDDPDCDGVSDNGRNLSHEYDLIDLAEFLDLQRDAE
jgi:hypothetical protein